MGPYIFISTVKNENKTPLEKFDSHWRKIFNFYCALCKGTEKKIKISRYMPIYNAVMICDWNKDYYYT